MDGLYPKPWPRASKLCAFSAESLGQSGISYSALVELQEQWVRVDLCETHFEAWKSQQKGVIAWWRQDRVAKRAALPVEHRPILESFQQMIGYVPSSAEGAKEQFDGDSHRLLLLAMALHRRKLAQIQLEESHQISIHVPLLELFLLIPACSAIKIKPGSQKYRSEIQQLMTPQDVSS